MDNAETGKQGVYQCRVVSETDVGHTSEYEVRLV